MAIAYQKDDATTVVLTNAAAAWRFIGYNGAHATSAGGTHDAQGVSETAGEAGEPIAVITGYTAPVEAAEAIAFGDFVKPAADGSGRAIVGTAAEHCGRALTAVAAASQLVEVEVLTHVHTPV